MRAAFKENLLYLSLAVFATCVTALLPCLFQLGTTLLCFQVVFLGFQSHWAALCVMLYFGPLVGFTSCKPRSGLKLASFHVASGAMLALAYLALSCLVLDTETFKTAIWGSSHAAFVAFYFGMFVFMALPVMAIAWVGEWWKVAKRRRQAAKKSQTSPTSPEQHP